MSRAFVKEDDSEAPGPRYSLPDPESDYYLEAAAKALIEGANQGNTRSAEEATGFRWGDPTLLPHIEVLLEQAVELDDLRQEQLSRRYIRAAGDWA